MSDWTQPTDEPLAPLLQREFFEVGASMGSSLEALLREEPVEMTRMEERMLVLHEIRKVHEHTLRLAMEIDRLKGTIGTPDAE